MLVEQYMAIFQHNEGQSHKEWIAPTNSTMICAEIAPTNCPVLAPYPQKNLT